MRKSEISRHSMIDLRGQARPQITVLLPKRGKKYTLSTPTKEMADKLSHMNGLLTRIGDGKTVAGDDAQLYQTCAAILEGNLENKAVSVKKLERWISAEDCIHLLCEYISWLTDLVSEKN